MEITFQNKTSDFEAFYEYALKETHEGKQLGKQAFIRRQSWVILIVALISALAWGILSNLGAPFINSLLTSMFLFIGALIIIEGSVLLITGFKPYDYFGRKIFEHRARQSTDKDLAIFQLPKTITIESDWLEIRNSAALHRWRWSLVDDIELMPDFIFLQVGKCDVYQIPKRDFQSEQGFVEFGNKLVELHKQHTDQHASADVSRMKSSSA